MSQRKGYMVRKRTKSWPFASPEQQIEGLGFVVKQSDIHTFEWSINILAWNKFISKSMKHKLLKRYRKIAGISYDNWHKSKPAGSNR